MIHGEGLMVKGSRSNFGSWQPMVRGSELKVNGEFWFIVHGNLWFMVQG